MLDYTKKILQNKSDYQRNLDFLDLKYNNKFTKLLDKEKNEINILSLFSEMEFGYLLNQVFEEVLYEPNLNGKTPDWVVLTKNDKIIFEVKKINPLETEMVGRIQSFNNNEYYGNQNTSFRTSIDDFKSQFTKITKKEEVYRDLILYNNYKLVICLDVINLHKEFITDTDLIDYFDFEGNYSLLKGYQNFCENVAGII